MTCPPLDPSERILMGPGPSNCHPRVLRAMAAPMIGHLDPEFLQIMDETRDLLRFVFQTKNVFTIAVSGTGSAGMETALVNVLEPGDEAIVCVNGVFGERMSDIVERCGGRLTRVDAEWGRIIEPAQVKQALSGCRAKVVAIVHAETSTGVRQPMEAISAIVHEAGALLLVDAVTSLGGCAVEVDKWDADVVYSGTQKCLSCPPGLSPVTFGARAMDALHGRRTKVQSWYLDMTMVERYWGQERFYHHTAPISMIYALHEALALVREEGLDARFRRHERNHRALAAGLAALGIELFAQEGHRLPMLNAVRLPQGIDDAAVRRGLLGRFHIEIGGGLGDLKGKAWRIGLMGHSSTANNVLLLLAALEQLLAEQGHEFRAGAGVAAANEVYSSQSNA